MEIRLGPAGNCISAKEKGTIGSLKRLVELGLNAQEIEFVRQVYMSNQEAKRAGEEARKLGIQLSIHGSYFVNLCNPDKQKASMWRIMQAVERGHHMGARVVVIHPGYYRKDKEKDFEVMLKACEQMARQARKKGWDDVLLGLETTGKHSAIGTLEENIQVAKSVPGCTVVVDWAHIFARQGGTIDFGAIFDALKPLKLKHMHTHFSCIEYTEKGERRHLPWQAKQPDYIPLVKEILKQKRDITLIAEAPTLEGDALEMKKALERAGYKF